jgi:hypothetical protein
MSKRRHRKKKPFSSVRTDYLHLKCILRGQMVPFGKAGGQGTYSLPVALADLTLITEELPEGDKGPAGKKKKDFQFLTVPNFKMF